MKLEFLAIMAKTKQETRRPIYLRIFIAFILLYVVADLVLKTLDSLVYTI